MFEFMFHVPSDKSVRWDAVILVSSYFFRFLFTPEYAQVGDNGVVCICLHPSEERFLHLAQRAEPVEIP